MKLSESVSWCSLEESVPLSLSNRVWENHRQGGGDTSSGSPSASPRHRHPVPTPPSQDPQASILKRLDTYEPPQPPPPVPPRTPLHTPRLEVKTMVDRDALLNLAWRYTSELCVHTYVHERKCVCVYWCSWCTHSQVVCGISSNGVCLCV